MSKEKTQQRLIHINAQSEIFSVFELVPEEKAVARLKSIRKMFEDARKGTRERIGAGKAYYTPSRYPNAKLVVKTCVHNPELPFIN